MSDNLQTTLNDLLQSGSGNNAALKTLINDYTTYHVVFVVVGGLVVIIFVLLAIAFWRRSNSIPKTDKSKWTVEKKIHLCFGLISIGVGLIMALIVAANTSNVVDPRGFSLLPASISTPTAGTQQDQLYRAFNSWLQSGSADMPSIIQSKINERVTFHTTKALVSAIVLVLLIVLTTGTWMKLIKRTQEVGAAWQLKEIAYLFAGSAGVALSLLLMVVVVANTQAAFGPITLTLLYG